jgi:hypothetical protein
MRLHPSPPPPPPPARAPAATQRLLSDQTIDRRGWPPAAHVARAVAMRTVCRANPHRRGLELVVGIADVLANNVGVTAQFAERHRTAEVLTDARADCVAMAIESLDAMCDAGVVDATSVWAKIRVHLADAAPHPRVSIALCRFVRHFGNAPDDDDESTGAPPPLDEDTMYVFTSPPTTVAPCLRYLFD